MKSIPQIIHNKKQLVIFFDTDGRMIYYEDADNYWAKWKFDSDGEEIYYENSLGMFKDIDNENYSKHTSSADFPARYP